MKKKIAFCSGDFITFRECKRVVRGKLREAKLHYKNKIEEHFTTGNVRQVWDGLNIMMGIGMIKGIVIHQLLYLLMI